MTAPYRTGHFDTSGTAGVANVTDNLRLTDVTKNTTVATPKVATPLVSVKKPHVEAVKTINPAAKHA